MDKIAENKTFNDYYHAMRFIAGKFRKKHPEYEVDELVNEIWLSYQYRHMPNYNCIWQACKWALRAYHRQQTHGDRRKWHVYFHQVPEDIRDDCSDLLARDDPEMEAVDVVDMLEHLPSADQEIISARLQGYTDTEIGDKLGRTKQSISWRRGRLRQNVA